MKHFSLVGHALLACVVALSAPVAACAATRTASISVSATVVATCIVTSSGVSGFGCASNKPVETYCTAKGGTASVANAISVEDCEAHASSSHIVAQDAQSHVLVTTIVF